MRGRARKRASPIQQQSQVRQGSSFWTCPACRSAVHTALMSFHISSCPVVADDELSPVKKRTEPLPPLYQQRTDEEKAERQGIRQSPPLGSPEFALVRKRGISPKKPLREDDEEDEFSAMRRRRPGPRILCAWEDDLDEEDMHREEQQQKGRGSSSSHPSVEAGNKGDKSLSCPLSETPFQEGRDRIGVQMSVSPSTSAEESLKCDPHPADVRKRLFEDWGQRLSPEPPELVGLRSPSPDEVAATSPSSVDPQAKRPKLLEFDESRVVVDLGLIDSGSEGEDGADADILPYPGTIQDSQQERQEEVVAPDHTEKSPEELGNRLGINQQLQADNICSLEVAIDIEDGKRIGDGFAQRELQLGNVIRELRDRCSGALLRESELQQRLELKEKECERLTELQQRLELEEEEGERLRTREQELQRELLFVRELLETTLIELRDVVNSREQKAPDEIHLTDQSPTQVYKEDESLATQLLSQISNAPASCCSSPRSAKDELVITRVSSGSSQNIMTAHNLEATDNKEQATPFLADGVYPRCSPPVHEAGESSQASAELRRVSASGTGQSDVKSGEPLLSPKATLSQVDKCPVRSLFDGGTEIDNRILKNEFSNPLPSSLNAAAVLAPHTLGEALLKRDEDEEREGIRGDGNANLRTKGNQQREGTPGPKTPEKFTVKLGGQEKVLIREMLDSFPPAQGTDTHAGIDPFDDHFLEAPNKTTSNVPSALKHDSTTMQEDGQTFVSDVVDQKFSHDNGRVEECRPRTVAQDSKNSQEETLGEIGSKRKRRKPALVIDSDSDADIGDEDITHHVGDSRKGIKDKALSGTKVDISDTGMVGQISNPAANSQTDPVMEASSRDTSLDQRTPSSPTIHVLFGIDRDNSLDQRTPSSPTINVLFGNDREDNSPGISAAGSRKRKDKPNSGNSPDPIIEILRRDRHRQLFSPPSVPIILSSDEDGDTCEGSLSSSKKGKRRRLVKVQESSDGGNILKPDPGSKGTKETSLQPDPDSEGTKETSTKLARRSERLRKVHTSVLKQSTRLSEQDGESDSHAGRSDGLGASGLGSNCKPHAVNDDEDITELDSDSSDGRLTGALHKLRKATVSSKRRYSGARSAFVGDKLDVGDEEEDDIETDDSSFINDDPESDVDASGPIHVDEISESGEESENDGSSNSKSSSDGRKKYTWQLEGDMLAALAKNAEICLRGLCAIYRRQEEDERIWASSKYRNKRGFSKVHSARASSIASFLMGDTNIGPVVKTVEELKEEFDENAVSYCSDMCIHYSKQLFEIYQNNEDPYFPEPCTSPMM